ncbi:hypothetical protein KSC_096470 [Ktedonobacter sp. SOSP1-52]|uniref:universal stress protein n=1 Tax=Ktedonobacter sp. SOSP1-52 TaxID=2778366 RepID=UPI001915A7A4|nr:universal stress protein [Ktedonobacter sp. SOSP1-52]GHO70755.1 hypothetical protein KSC_096470 [Ktedonobacter sp. SOSP1-52]
MRVLCCLDSFNVEELGGALASLLRAEEKTLGALYVTDTGPQEDMKRQRERFLRPSRSMLPRHEQMRQAEEGLAQEVLSEARQHLGTYSTHVELLQRVGRPEREIVQLATEWQADLIVICPRSPRGGGPALGPKSVGHVARFVLDHAPCPVLLVRPRISDDPLPLSSPPPPRPR